MSITPLEDAMFEFADILAYDLRTVVFMAGSAAILTIAALMVARKNRVPTTVRAFDLAPAFGL
jgi:hypothetical protein